jgi:hypothetical protein
MSCFPAPSMTRRTKPVRGASLYDTPSSIAGRRALFGLARYHLQRNRGGYDVFPNGEFVFLSQRSDTASARTPLVVRLNWTAALRTPPTKREP